MSVIRVNAVIDKKHPIDVTVGPVARFTVTMNIVRVIAQMDPDIRLIESGNDLILQRKIVGVWKNVYTYEGDEP